MRVLVTGASGNIGRRLVAQLAARGHDVVAADTRPAMHPTGVQIFAEDLLARSAVAERLVRTARPEVIVHLAALAGPACEYRPIEAADRNTRFTAELARLADRSEVQHFVFTSTSAVYQQTTLSPTGEEENVAPTTVYGRTKLAAEVAIEEVANGDQTAFSVLRIFNVYGAGMTASLCERLRTSTPGDPVLLTGWNNFYRDYLHVDEVARALRAAAEVATGAGYQVMNIGSGVARNNRDLIREFSAHGTRPSYLLRSDGARPSYSWADVSRAAEVLNYTPSPELVLESAGPAGPPTGSPR